MSDNIKVLECNKYIFLQDRLLSYKRNIAAACQKIVIILYSSFFSCYNFSWLVICTYCREEESNDSHF